MNSVLIVANSFSGGGAENSMMTLHKAFLGKGITSNFLAINSDGKKPSTISNIYCLDREWHAGIFKTISAMFRFKRKLAEISPDVIIINCELPELFAAFTNVRDSKIICVEHTTKPWLNRRILGRAVRGILQIKQSKWVTVVSDRNSIWAIKAVPNQIPNPFSLNISTAANYPTNKLKGIVYIGRFRREKRPEWAIQAAIETQLPINLFGDGEIFLELKAKYLKNQSVVFNGYVENPWELLSEDVLIVAPSEFEGDGLVVVEAIIRRKPIALAENSDFRRFKLPDLNYFNSVGELVTKINDAKKHSFVNLTPSKRISSELEQSRDIDAVVAKWKNLLFIAKRE